MSYLASEPDKSTEAQSDLLAALEALAVSGASEAIRKSSSTTFANVSVGGGASLTVKEVDGTPTVSSVDTMVFPNGTVTDDTGGQVTITISGSGDVTAAANFAVDNVLIKSDGTSKGVQATGISVADTTNVISGTEGITFSGTTSGTTSVVATAIAGTTILTLPAATDTLVGKATTDVFTNKSIDQDGTGNNITNIANASIKAAAAIAVNKLAALTASEIVITDASGFIASAAVATYPSLTELTYVKGVTSAIQTQLNAKEGTLTNSAGLLAALNDETGTGLVVFNNSPTFVDDITIGGAGIATGQVKISGTTSGTAIITVPAIAGTPTYVLPAAVGASGTFLKDLAGDGVLSWAAPAGSGDMILASAQTVTGTKTLGTAADFKLGSAITDKCGIQLNDSALNDETWSGTIVAATAGATLAVGDVCYLASTGKWVLNDGILDGTDTGFSKKLGICVLASTDTNPTEMLLDGLIASAAFPAFTVGSPVYLDDTAGNLVVAQPSTANFAIRVVGEAVSATVLHFSPSRDYIVHV